MSAPTPVLLGYADRFSVQAGETLQFMVSSEVPRFSATLVRLVHGDESPAGPGFREEVVPSTIDGTYDGRRQHIAAGSYVRVPLGEPLDLSTGFTVQAWIWPTTPTRAGGQALLAHGGFVCGVNPEGRVQLDLGSRRITHTGARLTPWRWAFVAASYNASTGEVALYQDGCRFTEQGAAEALAPASSDILIAARSLDEHRRPSSVFNGKIDRPMLFGRSLQADEVEALRQGRTDVQGVIAAWDFSADISGAIVTDRSGKAFHGRAINAPTRAVTDHTWTGDELHWTAAPEQYSAIHFHDDDLEDAGWEPSFHMVVPDNLRSGVYAARLNADNAEEYVPFFVRPPDGSATAEVAFIAPTMTYLAYANERLYWNEGYREKRPLLTPLETEPPDIDRYIAEHRELGLSLYDAHGDGSGCCYSSRLRPILNMRPKYRAWRLQDAPRHFAADLYLINWFSAQGIEYDVITDEDLNREGVSLLSRYRVVVTGSHPEYLTSGMHRAWREYLEQRGRVMYLGGNGFYWVTSVDPERSHLIELRRGSTGTRAWESSPGEGYHSTTCEPGGIWRLRGQAPQRLVGVGFAAQGWGGAAGYARLPASLDPRAGFIFEGVGDDEVIGDFGLVLDGAAGDEIDRYDAFLGSPPEAFVLATSAGRHSDYYQVTVEDVPVMVPGQGGTESPKVRADMVFFQTPSGGAVFSVGSINWLGSLGWNNYENNVSRITGNVLRRFLDPAPFGAS